MTPNVAATNQDSNVTNGAIGYTVNDNVKDLSDNTKRMHRHTTPMNPKAITKYCS